MPVRKTNKNQVGCWDMFESTEHLLLLSVEGGLLAGPWAAGTVSPTLKCLLGEIGLSVTALTY